MEGSLPFVKECEPFLDVLRDNSWLAIPASACFLRGLKDNLCQSALGKKMEGSPNSEKNTS